MSLIEEIDCQQHSPDTHWCNDESYDSILDQIEDCEKHLGGYQSQKPKVLAKTLH